MASDKSLAEILSEQLQRAAKIEERARVIRRHVHKELLAGSRGGVIPNACMCGGDLKWHLDDDYDVEIDHVGGHKPAEQPK